MLWVARRTKDGDCVGGLYSPGAVYTRIALNYSIPRHSLDYHMKNCVPKDLLLAQDTSRTLNAEAFLEKVNVLLSEAEEVLEKAKDGERHGMALQAIKTLQGLYEMVLKMAALMHEMKLAQARTDSEGQFQCFKEGLQKLDPAELRLFSYLMRKMNGEQPEESLSAILPARRPRTRPPQPSCTPEAVPAIDLKEKLEVEEVPVAAARTRTPQPSKYMVERSRRQVAERIMDSY